MGVIVSDRRTLVVGLGKTGLSCVRYLCEKGRDVAVADSRLSPPGLDELRAEWPDLPVYLGSSMPTCLPALTNWWSVPGSVLPNRPFGGGRQRGCHSR